MESVLKKIPRSSSKLLSAYLRIDKGFYGLLTGTSEALREETANLVAKTYLCMGTKDEGCPCPSCKRGIEEHPDVLLRGPSAAGNLLKASTEDALDFLATSSIFTGKKCVILNHAHKMTSASAGDLLKILEEHLPNVVILLTADSWDAVPATIRSRCRHVFTGDHTRQNLFMRMNEGGLKAKLAEELSRVGTGLEIDAYVDKDTVVAAHKAVPAIFVTVSKGDTRGALHKFAEFAAKQPSKGVSVLTNLLAKTAQDVLLTSFSAFTHINMPSRAEWYTGLQGDLTETFLLVVIEECKKVLAAPEQQRRALLIRALCLLSGHQKQVVKKKEAAA